LVAGFFTGGFAGTFFVAFFLTWGAGVAIPTFAANFPSVDPIAFAVEVKVSSAVFFFVAMFARLIFRDVNT
jgi:hypothetical protein